MSGQLLDAQNVFRDHCHDRESALWVILWAALQFTLTYRLLGRSPKFHRELPGLMMMFNLVAAHSDGTVSGGKLKIHFLDHYSPQMGVIFADCPVLDSLVETLTDAFSVRYAAAPTPEDVKALEIMCAREDLAKYIPGTTVYRYEKQMDKLHREGWLVTTIREALADPRWPEDDEKCHQIVQSRQAPSGN